MIEEPRLPMRKTSSKFRRETALEKTNGGSDSDRGCDAKETMDVIRHDYISSEARAFILTLSRKAEELVMDGFVREDRIAVVGAKSQEVERGIVGGKDA
jgi:hypothetical protein